METTFENAKSGDMVWSIRHGWGTITIINASDDYPIKVSFGEDYETFTFTGRQDCDDQLQTLFWDEVKIDAPPRPKRKIKKTMEAYANVYGHNNYYLHETKETADAWADESRIACVKLVGEYEVEE